MRPLTAIRRSLAPLGLALAAFLGCYNSGEGAEPDDHRPYFPTGIALSQSGRWLFLANSNFDLRYNAGTLQAYDVKEIRVAMDECRANAAKCEPDPARFVKASVRIGAFTADMRAILRRDNNGDAVAGGGRLLLPVRGDASLTTIDWDESGDSITMRCTTGAGPNAFGERCSPEWRVGTDTAKSDRGLALEGEPFGVAIPDYWPADANAEPRRSGGIAAVVHQSTGNVSLFVRAAQGDIPQGKLAYVLGGLNPGGTGIAALDIVKDGENFIPRFIVTNRTQPTVLILQYFPDTARVERSGLVLSDVVPITPQATGFDTRGVVVDPPAADEKRPTRVFLTNRTPAALVMGEIDPQTNKLSFSENFPLPIGPSRITRTSIEVSPGVHRTRIIAASFDARSIVVFDPDSRRISNVIRTHRGPYGMVVDEANKLAFISNFTDSTIQVLELDPANPAERIAFSVGKPSGPSR